MSDEREAQPVMFRIRKAFDTLAQQAYNRRARRRMRRETTQMMREINFQVKLGGKQMSKMSRSDLMPVLENNASSATPAGVENRIRLTAGAAMKR